MALSLLALSLAADAAQAAPKCGGRKATIVGTNGNDLIKTDQKGPDVIVSKGGKDTILAFRNKDVICSGSGNDTVEGGTGRDKIYLGSGDDYVDSGPGSDKITASGGDDTVVGGPGGERVQGGGGDDRLFGTLQDDRLFGQAGVDLLVGGHGIDRLRGGPGDDWMRGDTNRDRYFGDGGSDTLSFATATPPGPFPRMDGVLVDLRKGTAAGDDNKERVFGIENLVGSSFEDELYGKGGGRVEGGFGGDLCEGFASTDCDLPDPATATVFMSGAGTPDPGLALLGVGENDRWTIATASGGFRVTGSGLAPGPGCSGAGGGVFCADPGAPLGYVLAWGGGGGDRISIAEGFARTTLAKFDGGGGDDELNGNAGDNLLYAGASGEDLLVGGNGDDVLASRPGADVLRGGGGHDQLVTNDPCGGHLYDGGSSKGDIAGFAHTDIRGVVASLGGRGRLTGSHCAGTRILPNLEILEGTRFSDRLFGDGRSNPLIIAREGNDYINGRAGKDICDGGPGKDRLRSCEQQR